MQWSESYCKKIVTSSVASRESLLFTNWCEESLSALDTRKKLKILHVHPSVIRNFMRLMACYVRSKCEDLGWSKLYLVHRWILFYTEIKNFESQKVECFSKEIFWSPINRIVSETLCALGIIVDHNSSDINSFKIPRVTHFNPFHKNDFCLILFAPWHSWNCT